MEELKKSIAYFEESLEEIDEFMDECSPALQAELEEERKHFVAALDALRFVVGLDALRSRERGEESVGI